MRWSNLKVEHSYKFSLFEALSMLTTDSELQSQLPVQSELDIRREYVRALYTLRRPYDSAEG